MEAPCPAVKPGCLLVRTSASLVSAGTERMLVEFGKANWLEKARQQPEKVGQVINKIKSDGLLPALEAVRSKLDQPLALGYCNAGVVAEVGAGVEGWQAGDRVVSNGPHAEMVMAPRNLCAKIPASVADDEAAFAVLGAIALQGMRLAQPMLGELFAVTGLGLVGLIAVQLLRAQGCRVLGLDVNPSRCQLAAKFGAETVNLSAGDDPLAAASSFSREKGLDGVLITAATESNEPVQQAARMCRKRGRIVLVGVAGLELERADFYKKELSFQVSCSYGPGRYDPFYEEKGQDYPLGYVRWTAQRNMEAVLQLMAERRLDVKPLITHRFPLTQAQAAYQVVLGKEPSLGVILEYDRQPASPKILRQKIIRLRAPSGQGNLGSAPVIGFIGAGNYAGRILIPAFAKSGVRLKSLATTGGIGGVHFGRKFGFEETVTDPDLLFADREINAVVIATRHDSHARLVCRAIQAGKHVFVEKPLCLTLAELDEISACYQDALAADRPPPLLMVGFNRRFAPQITKIKTWLDGRREPKAFAMTINAGPVPAEHWTQDARAGGGRILGEACHFIDLLRFLAGARIVESKIVFLNGNRRGDTAAASFIFENGSIGTVGYLANGHPAFPKERLEIFCAGRIARLDNFRKLKTFGGGLGSMNLWRQDKGQAACAQAFVDAVRHGKPCPIPFVEIEEVARATIDLVENRSL